MNTLPLRRWLALLFFAGILQWPLSGCNTIEGAGEDVEAAGEAIEGSARENKPY